MHVFLQMFIRLNVGLIITLYKAYLLGATLILVYLLILKTLAGFLATDRSLKQIMVKNRSHMLSMVRDTSNGLLHYRHSGLLGYVKNNFYTLQDIYQNSKATDTNYAQRWLAVRLYCLLMCYPVLVMLEVICKVMLDIEPDFMIHSIKFTVGLDICFSGLAFINSFARSETYLSGIERIIDLMRTKHDRAEMIQKNIFHIDEEATDITAAQLFSKNIEFNRVTYKYGGALDFALVDATFDIRPKEKVVIVGLPNSGKHTVLNLLAGLSDHRKILSGSIKVGGRLMNHKMINHMGNETYLLNSNYVLFEGDLRTNIDPSRSFTDDEIIAVYSYLGLWSLLDSNPTSYDIKHQRHVSRGLTTPVKDLHIRSDISNHQSGVSFYDTASIVEQTRIHTRMPQVIDGVLHIEDTIADMHKSVIDRVDVHPDNNMSHNDDQISYTSRDDAKLMGAKDKILQEYYGKSGESLRERGDKILNTRPKDKTSEYLANMAANDTTRHKAVNDSSDMIHNIKDRLNHDEIDIDASHNLIAESNIAIMHDSYPIDALDDRYASTGKSLL